MSLRETSLTVARTVPITINRYQTFLQHYFLCLVNINLSGTGLLSKRLMIKYLTFKKVMLTIHCLKSKVPKLEKGKWGNKERKPLSTGVKNPLPKFVTGQVRW